MERSVVTETEYDVKEYVIASGMRYWPVANKQIFEHGGSGKWQPPRFDLVEVEMPSWARDLGVGNSASILVDRQCLVPGDGPAYSRCDWWLAAFYHLTGTYECEVERLKGPVHSYRSKTNLDNRLFEKAWVNRILLLLRRLNARALNKDENLIFGDIPRAEFILTHDVDAISLPFELRIKSAAFRSYNSIKSTLEFDFQEGGRKAVQAGKVALSRSNLWTLDALRARTFKRGIPAVYNFYAGSSGIKRGWPGILFDPNYDVGQKRLRDFARTANDAGSVIGLHPSFTSWRNASSIKKQRERLEEAFDCEVVMARQHWLRFSWMETWAAQEKAGIKLDMTLGFNDQPAFRNGAALQFPRWDTFNKRTGRLQCIPLLFADSHFYDYEVTPESTIGDRMSKWLDEVSEVGGIISVLWHPHTIHPVFGWGKGFEILLELLGSTYQAANISNLQYRMAEV